MSVTSWNGHGSGSLVQIGSTPRPSSSGRRVERRHRVAGAGHGDRTRLHHLERRASLGPALDDEVVEPGRLDRHPEAVVRTRLEVASFRRDVDAERVAVGVGDLALNVSGPSETTRRPSAVARLIGRRWRPGSWTSCGNRCASTYVPNGTPVPSDDVGRRPTCRSPSDDPSSLEPQATRTALAAAPASSTRRETRNGSGGGRSRSSGEVHAVIDDNGSPPAAPAALARRGCLQ